MRLVKGLRTSEETSRLLARVARPFSHIDRARMGALLDRIGNARVVLIGEATHGTSQFYRMRQRITRALIEERGFQILAIEADWPAADRIDEWVRDQPRRPASIADAFAEFPSWMWRNEDVLSFVTWLRQYNASADEDRKVAVRGLDLYSLYASISKVIAYLSELDPALANVARQRYDCFEPFRVDPGLYGSAVLADRYQDCEREATSMLRDLFVRRLTNISGNAELFIDAEQNARIVANAEKYYRAMYYAGPESWNLRDQHMFETLDALLDRGGPDVRAVVWAHNSHVGDATATEMSDRGETNLGTMCRARYGQDAYLIGFGTHTGTVSAASQWGGGVEIKEVRPSHRDSYERVFHDSGVPSFFLPIRVPDHPEVPALLQERRLQRAIGVVYRPESELQSHYLLASLTGQFDEYVWFDRTDHVEPLGRTNAPELPDQHPFLLTD